MDDQDGQEIKSAIEIVREHHETNTLSRLDRLEVSASLLGRAALGLIGGALILGMIVIALILTVNRSVEETVENREFDTERGAVLCLNLLVNPEREFRLPTYCYTATVAEHYPSEACVQFNDPPRCGSKFGPPE